MNTLNHSNALRPARTYDSTGEDIERVRECWRTMADWLDIPMLAIDASGTILHANPAARGAPTLALRGWIQPLLQPGRCAKASFREVIGSLQPGSMQFVEITGGDACRAKVALCQIGMPSRLAIGCAYLVIFPPLRGESSARFEQFVAEYSVSKAEARVLEGLLNGRRPKEIAARNHVAIATVRTQIRAILTKVAATSVAELMVRYDRFPAVWWPVDQALARPVERETVAPGLQGPLITNASEDRAAGRCARG
ncbi:MAG: LuxR C-terminal-related transcriptional regulator [Burkholderiaceae bacterium]